MRRSKPALSMGSMLDKPKTEFIDAEEGEGNGQAWGVSSIQGWRTEMEVLKCKG